jgi:hypothetical protein
VDITAGGQIIKHQFGIQYHPSHIWKLLGSIGWSCQKPKLRALKGDEEKIARWKRYRWPHIKKLGIPRGAHLVFLDEIGFLFIPTIRQTWAPRKKTPILMNTSMNRVTKIKAYCISSIIKLVLPVTRRYIAEKGKCILQVVIKWENGNSQKLYFGTLYNTSLLIGRSSLSICINLTASMEFLTIYL